MSDAAIPTKVAERRFATARARLTVRDYQIRPCAYHGSFLLFDAALAKHCAELEDVEHFVDELAGEATT